MEHFEVRVNAGFETNGDYKKFIKKFFIKGEFGYVAEKLDSKNNKVTIAHNIRLYNKTYSVLFSFPSYIKIDYFLDYIKEIKATCKIIFSDPSNINFGGYFVLKNGEVIDSFYSFDYKDKAVPSYAYAAMYNDLNVLFGFNGELVEAKNYKDLNYKKDTLDYKEILSNRHYIDFNNKDLKNIVYFVANIKEKVKE